MPSSTFGQRLKQARLNAKLSLEELGRRVGVSNQAVHKWEADKAFPGAGRLNSIAQALNVPISLLLTGQTVSGDDSPQREPASSGGRLIPMLLPEHLADIPAHVVRARRVMTRYMCSDQAFQIPIWDRSNEPVFTMGDTVVIDPAVTPEPGDMVAALIGEAKRPTFAKYVERAANGTRHVALVPLNSDWPEHHISPDVDVILGTMTEHTRPRRT